MIRLENVSKSFRVNGRRLPVVENLSLTLPHGQCLALLGRNGAGKSTLLKMIAGVLRPDSGRVATDGLTSWPVGLGGAFHGDLTGAQNVRFVARIYGVDTQSLLEFVEDFAEIGPQFHTPMRHYSMGMRSRVVFGSAMGIRFDTYLIDEVTAVGDAAFKRKSRAVFRERLKTASALMVSHNMRELRHFCDAGLILENGHLSFFDNIDDAIAAHRARMRG